MSGIHAERAGVVAAFLNNQRRQSECPDQRAIQIKVLCAQRPGAGRIVAGGIETERHYQHAGLEAADACQRLRQRLSVTLAADLLGQWNIQIESLTVAVAGLVLETGEVGIGVGDARVSRR